MPRYIVHIHNLEVRDGSMSLTCDISAFNREAAVTEAAVHWWNTFHRVNFNRPGDTEEVKADMQAMCMEEIVSGYRQAVREAGGWADDEYRPVAFKDDEDPQLLRCVVTRVYGDVRNIVSTRR